MRISVCITSYNQKRYLAEAIESILAQTMKPAEIAIVDDCSTDGSHEVIAEYHSRYPHLVQPIYHTRNTGVAQARVDALEAVTGDYVTYLDGDDRFLPAKLERESELLLKRPDVQIAFSNVYYIDEQGNRIDVWADTVKPPEGNVFCQTVARDFPKESLFRSELVDRRAWKQVGTHDKNLRMYEDYDMRIRLTNRLRVAYRDEPLSEYRLHGSGLSRVSFIHHFEALNYIYHKNRPLFNDLSERERKYVDARFRRRLAQVAVRAAMECLWDRRHLQAAELLMTGVRCDPVIFRRRWLLRSLAPMPLRRTIWLVRKRIAKIDERDSIE